MTLALASGQTMETIRSIPLTRINIPEAHPEAVPENTPKDFAQVMARQKRPVPANEPPVGKDGEGTGPKDSPVSEEGASREGSDPAVSPEPAALLTTLLPNFALPDPPLQSGEPLTGIAGGPFPLDLNAHRSNPLLFQMSDGLSEINFPLGQNASLPNADPGEGLLKAARPDKPGKSEAAGAPLNMLLRAPEDIRIPGNQTEPAFPKAFNPPEGTPQKDPMALAALDEVVLPPVPEALGLEGKGAPEIKGSSFPGKAKGGPSFSAPGPAVPAVDDGDLKSAVFVQEQSLKDQQIPRALGEKLSGFQMTSAEALPDPKEPSSTMNRPEPGAPSLQQDPLERVEPGIALRDPWENPTGTRGPEKNTPVELPADPFPGVIAAFSPPRVEGDTAARAVEGPRTGSSEWIEEARSVYHQFNRGLRQTLQQGSERIQMAFDPPRLGSIVMEINRDRSSVTAHLWTDNPLTKELLEFSQGQLQKTLELDGFRLDRFEVQVQPDLKSFQQERWFGGRQPSWENNREEGRRASVEGVIPNAPETATLRFSQGNQYVDTWV